jgi:hypothetical protein
MINKKKLKILKLFFLFIDAMKYSHYLFSIIDRNHKGTFTFDVKFK